MGLQLTTEQVLTMAPDSSSVTAGKKLGAAKHWKNLGQSPEALWGECQGSALYQVRIDLSDLAIQCSCPSRKQPCKHGLGLLLLTVNAPSAIPTTEPPEWVVSWLAKRAANAKRKETLATKKSDPSAEPTAAQLKNAEKRLKLVTQGVNQLDLWLNDLIRNGLGAVEAKPLKFWESQKAQMQDAQAQGLANRIARMAEIPNASANWPEKLLEHLGELALLSQAFKRLEQLEPTLQEDVRQLVGWNLKEDEVATRGEHLTDEWLTLGQIIEEADRGYTQRVWLLGSESKRSALLFQFSLNRSAFPQTHIIGAHQKAELVFWPSVSPQRAFIGTRNETASPIQDRLPGVQTFEEFFADVATTLARLPWRDRFLCVLRDVLPIVDTSTNRWFLRDSTGQALPLKKGEYWPMLIHSGGRPVDFAGEWNGEVLTPLGVLVASKYYTL